MTAQPSLFPSTIDHAWSDAIGVCTVRIQEIRAQRDAGIVGTVEAAERIEAQAMIREVAERVRNKG